MDLAASAYTIALARRQCISSSDYEEEWVRQLTYRIVMISEASMSFAQPAAVRPTDRELFDTLRRIGPLFRRVATLYYSVSNDGIHVYDQVLPETSTVLCARHARSSRLLFDIIASLTGGTRMSFGSEKFENSTGMAQYVTGIASTLFDGAAGLVGVHVRNISGRYMLLEMYTEAVLQYVMQFLPSDKRVTYIGGSPFQTVMKGTTKVHNCTVDTEGYCPMMRDEAFILTTAMASICAASQVVAFEEFIRNPGAIRCYNAMQCGVECDVLVVDHTKEPINLASAVALANLKGARLLYGWFFGDVHVRQRAHGTFGESTVAWRADDAKLYIGDEAYNRRTMLLDDFRDLMKASQFFRALPGVDCMIKITKGSTILYKVKFDEGFTLGRSLGGFVKTTALPRTYTMLDGKSFPVDLFRYCPEVDRPTKRGSW